MYVRLPCWPTRASSCHQSSRGLPLALSGMAAATSSAKFFYAPPGLRRPPRDGAGGPTSGGSLADAALVQLRAELLGDFRLQIDPPPAHDAVRGRIRARAHPRAHLRFLLLAQPPLRPAALPVRQSGQAPVIEAMHPVPERLAIHPTGACGNTAWLPLHHQRDRQHSPCGPGSRCRRRFASQVARAVIPARDRHTSGRHPRSPKGTRSANHSRPRRC
jgi:hypothetical protein